MSKLDLSAFDALISVNRQWIHELLNRSDVKVIIVEGL